jgi:predicted AlkP superfamily pyrophosphatase or phosphodiesterase
MVRTPLVYSFTVVAAVSLGSCQPQEPEPRPNLLILITLDQFRSDYLERYDDAFTGGIRRALDGGRRWPRALVDHAPALSYPGHATLATGSLPRNHGFTSNAWLEIDTDGNARRVFVARDENEGIVDRPGLPGLSPQNLLVTGLADWVRAADDDARAVALSTGSALALIYGGRALPDEARNHAYWLSARDGTFVTSTYFRSAYPDWVESFNRDRMPAFHSNRVWDTTVPPELRGLARADDASYEGDGVHTTFPHSFEDTWSESERPQQAYGSKEETPHEYYAWFSNSPFADQALFALAEEAVSALALGQRDSTDLLTIAVKSTDRIGHDYGPHSQEQLDIVLRLDRLIGGLLDVLDTNVGEGNYVVVLSADHGAPNVVEYDLDQGRPAHRITEREIQELLDRVDRLVATYDGPADDLAAAITAELERSDLVARAMTPAELGGSDPADEILTAYRNSYIPARRSPFPLWTSDVLQGNVGPTHPANWGIVVEYTENTQLWTAGSAHGSSYRYDREVPIVLFGADIEPGVVPTPARTVDVAPTLATLGGISFPDTVDGAPLTLRSPSALE